MTVELRSTPFLSSLPFQSFIIRVGKLIKERKIVFGFVALGFFLFE